MKKFHAKIIRKVRKEFSAAFAGISFAGFAWNFSLESK